MTTPPSTAPSTAEQPWPVRVVARKIGDWIGRLGEVWVEGQVTQLSIRGGTAYLVLRDPAADISISVTCRRDGVPPSLVEGAKVVARAKPDYFAGRGTLSLRASQIRPVGVGELLARLEKLKVMLTAEGLFDVRRKRALPFLPGCVGLITGRSSAAEHDVVAVGTARWPGVRIRVSPCAVQGTSAASEVIAALRLLDADPDVEVIVIARGGGSVEDLLPFSDEALLRAVAACGTPVVSAIGHESDTTLLDHVADVRAATPTDAAKRVVPDVGEEFQRITQMGLRVRRAVLARLDAEQRWVVMIRGRPVLADPEALVRPRQSDRDALLARARRETTNRIVGAASDLGHARARVTALSPAATLERGYAVVQTADGAVVRDAAQTAHGAGLHIRLASGRLRVTVDGADPPRDRPPRPTLAP